MKYLCWEWTLPAHSILNCLSTLVSGEKFGFVQGGWRQKLQYIRFLFFALYWTWRWRPSWIYASETLSCPVVWLLENLMLTSSTMSMIHPVLIGLGLVYERGSRVSSKARRDAELCCRSRPVCLNFLKPLSVQSWRFASGIVLGWTK